MNAAAMKIVMYQRKKKIIIKKMQIKHVCFDLDGTLVDSFRTIFNATLKTLKQLKINNAMGENDFRIRIGHHFKDIFRDLKIDVPDIEGYINIYKQYYFDFIDQSELYPLVTETLSSMKQNGFFISLLTTKTQEQAEKIIQHFNLSEYFDFIMGRREGIPVKPNPEPLIEICKTLKIKVEETIMVGDTELDISCGKSAGSLTCAVLYGYRGKEKLIEEKADYYINSITELTQILNKKAIAK